MKDNCIEYIVGDSRELIRKLPDKSIKMAVTSPPYNIGKNYGKYNDKLPLEEWKELISDITKEMHRVLTEDGSFFMNVSPIPFGKDKEILPLQFLVYEIFKEHGFYLRNMITWTFNNMQNPTKRLAGRYEIILWGVKDLNNYIFNLDDIRVPYLTKNDKRLTGSGRNPTDVWYFDRVNNMTKKKLKLTHPTVYPMEMIERIIKMATNEGDTVLDPFAGSGTSLLASKKLNRKAIGFDIDKNYKEEFNHRVRNELNTLF